MAFNPTTYEQLEALWRKFDVSPEASFVQGGAVIKGSAYTAFLEARQLIERLRHDLFAETKGWRPIATFFEEECDTPRVLLWAQLPATGAPDVVLGYWDDDEQAWYREGEGPDLESTPVMPSKWMALGELMRSADDREFVAIPRID